MKIYSGRRVTTSEGERLRTENQTEVEIFVRENDGIPVSLPHAVTRHSPTGFQWGYLGSGPAELALNILYDYLQEEPEPWIYQAFKDKFVGSWEEEWEITGEEIEEFLEELQVEVGRDIRYEYWVHCLVTEEGERLPFLARTECENYTQAQKRVRLFVERYGMDALLVRMKDGVQEVRSDSGAWIEYIESGKKKDE